MCVSVILLRLAEQQAVEQQAVEQQAVVGQLQFSRSVVLGVQAAMVEWFLAALVVRPAVCLVEALAAVCQPRVAVAAVAVCQPRVAVYQARVVVAPVDRVVQETLLSQWECRLLHPDRRGSFSLPCHLHLPRTLLFKRHLLMAV